MKKRRILFFIFLALSIAINVFILIEGAVDASGSSSQSLGITQFVINIFKAIAPNSRIATDPEFAHHLVRKLVGHFGLFGVSGILTTLTFIFGHADFDKMKKRIVINSLVLGLSVAVISELLQLTAPGRAFAFTDILIDFSGYLLFGGITFLIYYLIRRRNQKKIKEETKE